MWIVRSHSSLRYSHCGMCGVDWSHSSLRYSHCGMCGLVGLIHSHCGIVVSFILEIQSLLGLIHP